VSDKGVFLRWYEYQDKSTSLSEKFIYKEIESLSMLELGCIAKNDHFATIMGIKETAVSRLINSLKDKGFITVKIKNGSRNHGRKITLNKLLTHPKQFVNSPLTNCEETKGNKSINKPINNNIGNPIPVLQDVVMYLAEKQLTTLVDAEKFMKFYDDKNWKNVHDWKDKIKVWADNKKENQSYSEIINPIIKEITTAIQDGFKISSWKTKLAYTIYRQQDQFQWNQLNEKGIEFKIKELHKKVKNSKDPLLELPTASPEEIKETPEMNRLRFEQEQAAMQGVS